MTIAINQTTIQYVSSSVQKSFNGSLDRLPRENHKAFINTKSNRGRHRPGKIVFFKISTDITSYKPISTKEGSISII